MEEGKNSQEPQVMGHDVSHSEETVLPIQASGAGRGAMRDPQRTPKPGRISTGEYIVAPDGTVYSLGTKFDD